MEEKSSATGLFPDRQIWAQGESLQLEGEDTRKKNRLDALGNRNPFFWKKDWGISSSEPWHPPGWRRHLHRFGLGAVFLMGWSGLCAQQTPVWSTPLWLSVCLGAAINMPSNEALSNTVSGWVCFACFRVGRTSSKPSIIHPTILFIAFRHFLRSFPVAVFAHASCYSSIIVLNVSSPELEKTTCNEIVPAAPQKANLTGNSIII